MPIKGNIRNNNDFCDELSRYIYLEVEKHKTGMLDWNCTPFTLKSLREIPACTYA